MAVHIVYKEAQDGLSQQILSICSTLHSGDQNRSYPSTESEQKENYIAYRSVSYGEKYNRKGS